jgi:hypothetical protein
MRSGQARGNAPAKATDGSGEGPTPELLARYQESIERIAAERAACEALGDDALARRTGRTLLAVVGCAADALLRDGGQALTAAPDKFGAFFDKAAAGFVQTIAGMHNRAVLMEVAARAGGEDAAGPDARGSVHWSSIPPHLRGMSPMARALDPSPFRPSAERGPGSPPERE